MQPLAVGSNLKYTDVTAIRMHGTCTWEVATASLTMLHFDFGFGYFGSTRFKE